MAASFRLIPLGEDADPDLAEEATGLDFYAAWDAAETLFEAMNIRASRAEELVLGAVSPSGELVGAATYGNSQGDMGLTHTFSVVVAPLWRRKGVARALVSAVTEQASEVSEAHGISPQYMVWVVNPHMAALLESLGFETEGNEWTQESPHMTRSYNNPSHRRARPRRSRRARRNPDVSLRRGELTLPDGKRVRVAQIGKGMFSVAYVTGGRNPRVYTVTKHAGGIEDHAKEILAMANDDTRNKWLPRVKRVGHLPNGAQVVEMPLYKAPLRKADSPTAWAQYRVLEKCWKDGMEQVRRRVRSHQEFIFSGHRIMDATIECAKRNKQIPKSMVFALELLRSNAGMFGASWTFEFSPRNLATDARGNLILLDSIFSMEAVEHARRNPRRR